MAAVSRFCAAAATASLRAMTQRGNDSDGDTANSKGNTVLGHVIPRRRFTRWAAWYFLLYCGLPVLALGLLVDLLLYTVFTGLFGRCYAIFCLFT